MHSAATATCIALGPPLNNASISIEKYFIKTINWNVEKIQNIMKKHQYYETTKDDWKLDDEIWKEEYRKKSSKSLKQQKW